jgi:hypothetical protein
MAHSPIPTSRTVMRHPTLITLRASNGGMTAAPAVNPMCATDMASERRRCAQRVTAVVVEGTNPSNADGDYGDRAEEHAVAVNPTE